MNKRINRLIKCGLILTSLVAASAVANEDRTKKDLSEVQNALEQSQAEYNAQRKKIASLQKNLKSHELDIAKNAKALNMAEQSVKEAKTQQKELQSKADELDKKIAQLSSMRDGLRHAAACSAANHFECPNFLRLLNIAGKGKFRVAKSLPSNKPVSDQQP